jgi:glycosyltransferase involved in cell wall biosynthesis
MKDEQRLSPHITVVIPAFCVEKEIDTVLQSIPSFVNSIVVVNDASTDQTESVIRQAMQHDERIFLVCHAVNRGVGGAMISGFQKALTLPTDIVVKLDGDGQMDPAFLNNLIAPLLNNQADYAKGNRFYDFVALRKMPFIRRFGNTILGFLSKTATGYWNLFDPTNGYLAIRAEKLKQLNLANIASSYYFETSMLANLYLINARIVDVPIPAVYKGEISNLKISRVLWEFPFRLLKDFLKRIFLRYFLYDFSMVSVYIIIGVPMLLFGIIFGTIKWIDYAQRAVQAPTGTVILPMMCVLLGIQFLLSAIHIDIQSMPK